MNIIIEGIGWIGMALVLVSFIVTGERNIRILNWLGCFFQASFFVLNGGMIKNLPIFTLNVVLIFVNTYHLFISKKLKKKKS